MSYSLAMIRYTNRLIGSYGFSNKLKRDFFLYVTWNSVN